MHLNFRIFGLSAVLTVGGLLAVLLGMGADALVVALVLVLVEVAFSIDNAVINAKILEQLSRFWQQMFLTIGAFIAIFGMRMVFPILIVAFTAHLGWGQVLNLALHHPEAYAAKLQASHIPIAAFGGGFLLILALDFFIDPAQKVMWLTSLERSFKRLAERWAPPVVTLLVIALASSVPANHHQKETFLAGAFGLLTYNLLYGLTAILGKLQGRTRGKVLVGSTAFMTFLYLQILDASFSFDGVIGAFAITNKVVLIAVGLGIGALWVRALTVFMVRHKAMKQYIYIEHGAHYTILVLALVLLVSIFYDVPQVITGLIGFGIIGSSLVASRQALKG